MRQLVQAGTYLPKAGRGQQIRHTPRSNLWLGPSQFSVVMISHGETPCDVTLTSLTEPSDSSP
jgi:hypothetical protein